MQTVGGDGIEKGLVMKIKGKQKSTTGAASPRTTGIKVSATAATTTTT